MAIMNILQLRAATAQIRIITAIIALMKFRRIIQRPREAQLDLIVPLFTLVIAL
jgi:hypothetical protein